MLKLLINWALNAIAFLITQRIIDQILPGQFRIRDFVTALIAALALGLINSTIRPVLKFLTLFKVSHFFFDFIFNFVSR